MMKIEYRDFRLFLPDQRFIPHREESFECKSTEDVVFAIKEMVVRGAPAIGIAAAFGAVIAANETSDENFSEELNKKLDLIGNARPTAVNLSMAIGAMKKILEAEKLSKGDCVERFLELAEEMTAKEIETDRLMGEFGATLIKDKMTVLTHCNTGTLATVGIGTALGVIKTAYEKGLDIKVYADETRPRLQGLRLTAYELKKSGIPFKVIADSAAHTLIRDGKIDAIFVGADRIAKNGDTANKIGTFGLSVSAKVYNVPFYVVAPRSTFDFSIMTGDEIEIEERDADEILEIEGVKLFPERIEVYNPAFDVTPWENITAIICEDGIYYPAKGGFGF